MSVSAQRRYSVQHLYWKTCSGKHEESERDIHYILMHLLSICLPQNTTETVSLDEFNMSEVTCVFILYLFAMSYKDIIAFRPPQSCMDWHASVVQKPWRQGLVYLLWILSIFLWALFENLLVVHYHTVVLTYVITIVFITWWLISGHW